MPQDAGRGPLAKVTLLDDGDRSDGIYDEWADRYEADLLEEFGYSAHTIAARALTDRLDLADATIIDYGCGTGLVGAEMHARGFRSIDGADYSSGMLDRCRDKGIYRTLIQADLTGPVEIPDAEYDAMVCVGVLGAGHLYPEHFRELFRTVAPGGPIVIFGNGTAYADEDYETRFATLETEGHWSLETTEDVNYMAGLNRPGVLLIGRR